MSFCRESRQIEYLWKIRERLICTETTPDVLLKPSDGITPPSNARQATSSTGRKLILHQTDIDGFSKMKSTQLLGAREQD